MSELAPAGRIKGQEENAHSESKDRYAGGSIEMQSGFVGMKQGREKQSSS